MNVATTVDVGSLVVAAAAEYVGAPSAHHSKFHTGIYFPENERIKRDAEVEEFLRKWAGLCWTSNYYTYIQEAHLPHSVETGLDCSGFVNLAIKDSFHQLGRAAEVPRHTAVLYSWSATMFVPLDKLQPGDLLFLQTNRRRTFPDHIGVYLGNSEVVHSPGVDGSKVKVINLESFVSDAALIAAKRVI